MHENLSQVKLQILLRVILNGRMKKKMHREGKQKQRETEEIALREDLHHREMPLSHIRERRPTPADCPVRTARIEAGSNWL